MSKKINLGARIIGEAARATQVQRGETAKVRLGWRLTGLKGDAAPVAEVPVSAAAEEPVASIERHVAPAKGYTVKEMRALITEDGADLIELEEMERARADGARRMVLQALADEHERRRTAHPEQYPAEGEDGQETDEE